jgi:hypothetical protein
MLARYKIYRGKRLAGKSLPAGLRQDTRKHTRHCLRPPAESVAKYLADPGIDGWERFAVEYAHALDGRLADDRSPFDHLAELARGNDVFIGCSCPTLKNPDVNHCHTVLALGFMAEHYPDLQIVWP